MSYWTVARTESQREHVAARHLARAKFEIYLPRVKLRRIIEPLFPGYLFVRIESHWHTINTTIGVLHVLLSGEHPAFLHQQIINEIRMREDRRGLVRLPKPTHAIGQKVHIKRGNFANHVGIYDGSSRKDRERVLLEILGRMVVVDIAPGDLEFPPT
jgi:transcriptional antiterminator RfaH